MTSTGFGRAASRENCLLQEWRLSAKDSDRDGRGTVGYHTVCFSAVHYPIL